MKSVKVRKEELLSVLRDNRENHATIFEQAVEGYRSRAVELLEDHINRIRDGKVERVHVILPRPEDHTVEYDRAIKMVEMSVDEEITLDNTDFEHYVMDDWAWKRDFMATATTYVVGDLE